MINSSRIVVDILIRLIQDAFDGDPEHSLLANLREIREAEWTALPPGCSRSIADILEHVAWAKWMYEDYAFGPATLPGDQSPMIPADGARARPPAELLAWLNAGHACWLASVQALSDDAELDRERLTNWGERLPTRIIIQTMIAHDYYHAGEINHLRALLHQADKWEYE
jgi:uncharacterized damage-inducible protein DinB